MAFASKGTLGATGNKTAASSIALTTITTSLSSGDLCVVIVAKDPLASSGGGSNTNECTSVTDSVGGNTWTKAFEWSNATGAATGAVCAIFYSVLTNAIPTGSTITANFTSVTAKAITAYGFTMGAGSTVSITGTSQGVSATSTSASTTIPSLTAGIEILAIRGIGIETSTTTACSAANYTNTDTGASAGGSGATNERVSGMFHIVTPSGTTENCNSSTGGTSGTAAHVHIALKEVIVTVVRRHSARFAYFAT